jgi:iron complex outermembrane recepter protein
MHMLIDSVRRGKSVAVSSLALSLALISAPSAMAQVATPSNAEADAEEDSGTIVVTGSRIARSGFDTPTPVTVVGQEQIARQGASNIAQVLNEIPAFRAQSTPTTSAIFIANLGASTADLRGLGGNRTLVLIDGRRVVASAVAGSGFTPANTVDLNLVPSTLLKSVEVVTGGASAAYGSDAVAGVTNLIIDNELEGIRASLQYGTTEQGDNEEYMGSLAFGSSFADGRGRVVVGAEYVNSRGTGDCYTRAWCAESYNTVNNPFVTGSTTQRVISGQPAIIILPDARTATASLNGLVVTGPLRGTEFLPGGGTFQHNYGIYGSGLFQSGGGDPVLPFYQFFPLSTPSERINTFLNAEFDAADDLTLFVQGSFGHVEGNILGVARRDVAPTGSYQIQRTNAFLPTSVRDSMTNLNLNSFGFGRMWNDIGPQEGSVTRQTWRAVTGFEWEVGGGLSLNGYYQHGETDYSQRGFNTTVNSRMRFAIDAVDQGVATTGTANGNIVCRATIAGLPTFNAAANGCVPLNPFGLGAGSPAAFEYVTDTATQDTTLTQDVFALTLSGEIVELWAGPLAFAAGAEYRRDGVESVTDAISAANDFHTSPGGGIVGNKADLNVKEGFIEVALPLARDLPFAQSAEINGAFRVTDYSNSGQVETWKVGIDWQPVEFLRLRATRSRDIRAPNLFELFGAPQSSFQTVDDGAAGRLLVPTLLSGSTTLQPEVADTWTAGAVLDADLGNAGRLRASVDWFDISLDGAIGTLGAQVIRDRCTQGLTAFCQFVTRDGNGALTRIVNPNLNLNTLITRGWDVETNYTLPMSAFGGNSDADLEFRVLATFVKDLITIDSSGTAVDRAGQNGSGVSQPSGLPDYTINAFLTYQADPFSAQIQVRHIAPGRYNVTNIGPDEAGYSPLLPNSISDNSVEAVTYVNMNVQFQLIDSDDTQVELFGVINNLFDKDPPNDIPSSFGPTNNVLYDVLGRSFKIGVRVGF